MKKLAIIGSGDLGRLAAYHAGGAGYTIAGFFDDYKAKGADENGATILGGLADVKTLFAQGVFDELFVAVGYKHMAQRESIFSQFLGSIPFANIIHASSFVDPSVKLGTGIFILPGCTIDCGSVIGNNVLLNTGCTIAHDTQIGDHCFLSPAVKMAGFIKTGKRCVIGIGTTVIDNITIGDDVQTGGGSLVAENLDQKGLYYGVPARFKKTL